MSCFDESFDHLANTPICGYHSGGPPAVEPTALAAMALLARGRDEAASQALEWLADLQSDDGSLGVDRSNRRPCWPTGWAVLAWRAALADEHGKAEPVAGQGESQRAAAFRWAAAAEKAVAWILSLQGRGFPQSPTYGHDTTLRGWPWVESTHSWVEPTAISVMALKCSDHTDHARCREAVDLLLNRMLPRGGWNYGNTVVLGNTLRPQLQPTGLALAALAGEQGAAEHVRRSIGYLDRTLCERTTTASLSYALMGAAAHGHRPAAADRWLEAACRRTLKRDASPYKLALVTLARSVRSCPGMEADLIGQQG